VFLTESWLCDFDGTEGNEWTASAHVITAVIGSGVLSLAWSMAQLGWVAGPGTMVVFASVTALQSTIFADCYRSPDPEHGPHRNRTYASAVERNLGTRIHVSPRFRIFVIFSVRLSLIVIFRRYAF
jgi:amino acid permease